MFYNILTIIGFLSFYNIKLYNTKLIHNELNRPSLRLLASTNLVSDSDAAKANDVSNKVRETMKKLRGGTDGFYNDLFKALLISTCQIQIDQKTSIILSNQRYVDKNDVLAYKDSNGKCIEISKPENEVKKNYDSGKCEVKPNCFWRPINETDRDRYPVYATGADTAMERKDGEMGLNDANKILQKWGTGLAVFIAPGIILAILTILTMLLFLLCRCCCNKCGGRYPNPNGYKCTRKLIPILFFLFFSICIGVCAGIALLYNRQLTNAVGDLFNITKMTLNDSSNWIDNVRKPLNGVKDTIRLAGNDIRITLNNTDFIELGLTDLTSKLNNFAQNTADRTLPKGCTLNIPYTICIPCTICTSINNKVTIISNQMNNVASSGITSLKDTRNTLNKKVADQSESIFIMIDTQINSTKILSTSIDDATLKVQDVRTIWDTQDVYRAYGVLALFVLSVIVIGFGLIGVFFGLTPFKCFVFILHIAYMIGFVALFVSFILASVLIALSVLLSDVCEITNIMKQDWSPVLGKDASLGLNACFHNDSLLNAFNLTNSLNFTSQLNFQLSLDTNTMLNFSEFDTFQSQINTTTSSTFDTSSSNTLVTILNTLTGPHPSTTCNTNDISYTLNNVLTPWVANGQSAPIGNNGTLYISNRYTPYNSVCNVLGPFVCGTQRTSCLFSDYVVEAYKNISTMKQIQLDADTFIVEMKQNMTNVGNVITSFKTNTNNLNNNIKNILSSLTNGVVKEIDNFKKAMYCNFVSNDFNLIMNTMCNDLIPALTMISLSTFLMGLFLIAVNICLIILSKRLRVTGNGEVIPKDTEFK